ncbi:MAG: DUF4142 domain-containing protein [Polyangia bacterium]
MTRMLLSAVTLTTTLAATLGFGSVAFAVALDDAAMVEVVHTANTGEIDAAKLASSKATSADVKKFASMMIEDHTKADEKGTELAKKLELTPTKSAASMRVAKDSATAMKRLMGASPTSFDRAYMESQITAHTRVLAIIDKTLVPDVKSPELKGFLEEVRAKVAMHLDKAKKIHAALP